MWVAGAQTREITRKNIRNGNKKSGVKPTTKPSPDILVKELTIVITG